MDSLREAYLNQAQEAEDRAQHIADAETAAMWSRIAGSYRQLADEQEAPYWDWT